MSMTGSGTSTTGGTESSGTTGGTTNTPPTGDPILATGTSTSTDAGDASGPSSSSTGFDLDPPECDLFAQDCPPGQKCSFFDDDLYYDDDEPVAACVPVTPDPRQPGELCHFNEPGMGLDDCAPGSFCLPYRSDGAGASVCVALCEARTYDCPDAHLCILLGGGLFWCHFMCDPLLQNCSEGLACDSMQDCSPVSPGRFDRPPGAPCESTTQCTPRSTCFPAKYVPDCAAEWCCTELCDLQAPSMCTLPDQSCEPPPRRDNLGILVPDGVGLCLIQ
jgi:hypothetical protein